MHAEFNKRVCAEHEQRCMWNKQTVSSSNHCEVEGHWDGSGCLGLGWDEMCRVEMCRAGLNAGLNEGL